jgi:hypothetical protein
MTKITKLAKEFSKKYSQVLPLGESEGQPITVGEAESLAAEWYNQIPQTQSQYTTAKELLGFLTGNRASKALLERPITAHSRYWSLDDVKKYHSQIIDPEQFKEVVDVLWNFKKPQL